MIVLCRTDATPAQRDRILAAVRGLGVEPHVREQDGRFVVESASASDAARCDIERLAGVERVFAGEPGAHLATSDHRATRTKVRVGDVVFGGPETVVIAGPCAIEGRDVLLEIARAVKAAGASVLRGGAFKPRTSPYAFRGLGEEGLRFLAEARDETGLPVVTEVMDPRDVPLVERHADMLQIGSRSMHNFALLAEVGRTRKPVLLKRGMSATLEEWLMAAEYVMAGGNYRVILCERGVRTFSDHSRNTLDLSVIPPAKSLSHLPVFVDPSHGTGKRAYVPAMSLAALAAGADGLLVEAHPEPDKALSDGAQSLDFKGLQVLMGSLRQMVPLMGRKL
jgi:3-deoxy-7-phosphoheptulonate synthase